MQRKMMADEEQIKIAEVQDRIKTLEQARKLEAKTQELNEMALEAELKAKSNEMAIRERQVSEAKRLEIAKLEIAKREGRESLSEADLARIRNERLKAENLAKAAKDHAIRESNRPVARINLGHSKVAIPPPPVPHPLPPPMRPRSAHSMHQALNGSSPLRPPSAQSAHRLSSGPRIYPSPMPNSTGAHRLAPPQSTPRMRRMSDSHAYPTAGPARPQSHGLAPGPYPDRHIQRRTSGNMSAEIMLRAHAERLRRKRFQTLDLKARQHNLIVQALRDLRKRELAAELRDRGIQQREIETQVALLAERDRALNEAQLREMRDREHRLRLKEKGLQEREILDQVARRQESDREALRRDLEFLERQLQHKELLEAELAIKRAIEKGESPPMGIGRPSMEEIETEGLLNDIYDELDMTASPYLNPDLCSDYSMSVAYRPRTPSGGQSHLHTSSITPNLDSLSRAPSVGRRTPQIFPTSPGPSMRRGEEFLGDNLRTPARSRSQSFGRRPLSAASHHTRQASPSRERNGTLNRQNSNISLNRQEIASIVRTESRAALREHEARERERAEKKAEESERLRQELRARQNSEMSHRMLTPSAISHQRTPSMRETLDPNYYSDGYRHDLSPIRPSSRASSRVHDYDSISRPMSRAGSMRDEGLSPTPPRLGLPSRPSSRNLTAEDLGLDFGRDKIPMMKVENAAIADEVLAARLASADFNSKINGGTRSRANSHIDQSRNEDYLYGDRNHLTTDFNALNMNSGRSRSGSYAEPSNDSYAKNDGNPFGSNGTNVMRSRSNSNARLSNDLLSSNQHRDHFAAEPVNTGGRLSRASSINQVRGTLSPSSHMNCDLKGQIIGISRSPHGDHQYDTDHDFGHLTNEELAQLSTEELELILNARGVRSHIGNEALNLPAFRRDGITQQHPIEPILNRHELAGGSIGGMSNMGVGGNQSRNLNNRSSHVEAEHSPLFVASLYPHSPIQPPRPVSRAESSRHYNGSNPLGQRYDQPSRTSLRSNHPSSFAQQPSHQYADRYHQPNTGLGYPNQNDMLDQNSLDAANFPHEMNEDEFVITERPQPSEARILDFIGEVEALAPRSSTYTSRFDRDVDRQDMHQAVRNLISKSSQLGANGIVSMRVNDTNNGAYLATGVAVILEKR